jgi:hypothetical protein
MSKTCQAGTGAEVSDGYRVLTNLGSDVRTRFMLDTVAPVAG